MSYEVTRRDFMKHAALFSALGVAPQFLARTVEGQPLNGFKDDRVLVVVQLGGGNDGLNTVVPYAHDDYHRSRPALGLKKDRLLTLNDEVAFNDSLANLKHLYDDGQVGVIQGVGYPNPNRSHFRSMEIWHSASDTDEYLSSGWIGRYFDHTCSGETRPQVGVAVQEARPDAFSGERGLGVAFEDPAAFGWRPGKGADTEANFERLNSGVSGHAPLDFLRHMTSNAILSSREVQAAAERAKLTHAPGKISNPLKTVAGLIRANLETRVYYVSVSGFDTHAGQAARHDQLLTTFATYAREFQDLLAKDGTADRVMTLVFSEFGRRVKENGSGGTDHGTAGPMFLIGKNVKPGLHGNQPSLSDLDDGDLKFGIDFRSVYSTVLENWLVADAQQVLGKSFSTLPLIA